ncbi:hypothetical protein CC86DRAFT_118450 [Ophiobolus disseminans]|uniref:Uncharacterized protein n=1 Tax=Ophiobolus disseminans TaxID=1469910 RepID=A0A6A6ZIZ0_9PLEO|nr:hypothetical protein CC86DRAFT_118450 [Ophiobolus disseminans]
MLRHCERACHAYFPSLLAGEAAAGDSSFSPLSASRCRLFQIALPFEKPLVCLFALLCNSTANMSGVVEYMQRHLGTCMPFEGVIGSEASVNIWRKSSAHETRLSCRALEG